MIKQIISLAQFTSGSSQVWDVLTTPPPDGVVSFSIDDGVFKLGDGVNIYRDLPTLFTLDQLIGTQVSNNPLFKVPLDGTNGRVVVISNDLMYSVSDTSLAELLTAISTLESTVAEQTAEITAALPSALLIDSTIATGADTSVVVVESGKLSDSGVTVAEVLAQIAAGTPQVSGSHMMEPVWYADSGLTNVISKYNLYDYNTYYVKLFGFNNTAANPVFTLTSANVKVIVTQISGPVFSVRLNGVSNLNVAYTPIALVSTVDDGTGTSVTTKTITAKISHNAVGVSVYGGAGGDDEFSSMVIDQSGNIICVGQTASEGTATDALVVKFDTNLNILARKRYGGAGTDYFTGVAVGSSGNIYCVGYTQSEGTNLNCDLVVKFDSSLNIIARIWRGITADQLYCVTVDSADSIICAGLTYAGSTYDCGVLKYDANLNLLTSCAYGGGGTDYFSGVAVDSTNNIICVGNTASEGTATDALVVKFDTNLNIIARKRYGGAGADYFNYVAVDSTNNIICAGSTASEGAGTFDALVVKFDTNLNILARKRYGGSGGDYFNYVAVDSAGSIICAGFTASEGAGGNDALVVKFDTNLNILARKRYGGALAESFRGVAVDSSNNIICVGFTASGGAGGHDALVVKLPLTIPSGTFTGAVLTNLTMADSNLTLADSALTLADSALTLTAPVKNTGTSNLTLANSTLVQIRDSFVI